MYESDDVYPRPLSDPEADGLPGPADDDSNAYDEVDSSRAADGTDPAPLPPDREDGPDGLEEFGTGGEGGLRGEPLWRRLRREVPDVSADRVPVDPDARLAEEADPDALDQLGEDSLELAEDGWVNAEPGEVSVYDRPISGVPTRTGVGRLVQPDDGGLADVDGDEYAYDAGPAGGGASAEEDAVHIIRPDTADDEDDPGDDARYDASL